MADDKQIIFSMVKVGKTLPSGKSILKDIYLSFYYGAKIGILGLNGAGKSTLMRIIAGKEQSYDGEVVFSPGYTVGHLEQEPVLDESKTVIEIVREGVQPIMDLLKEYEQVNEKFADPEVLEDPDKMQKLIDRQGVLQDKIEAADAWNIDQKLEVAMDALRCPEGETSIKVLSGGERRRVALCRLLLQQPDILLLDEPTNHLDAESVAWLELHLQQYKGTVIAVTHDRYFLDNVAGWILELDRGHGIPWKGNYSSWLAQKEARLAKEEKSESARQRTLQRELEWINMSSKGQRAKSKARIASYNKLLAEQNEKAASDMEIYIPPGPRLGNIVVQANGISKAYGDNLLYDNLSFDLPPGGIVGIIGPNGAGKTTLFRMMTGQEKPDGGSLTIGETVEMAYVDQSRDTLDPNKTVWQEISDGQETLDMGGRRVNSRAYVGRFNFGGGDQQKKVGDLSGGERNRVHLAKILKSGGNLLLLDEPTNDLDVNTLRALEEALDSFAGSAVVISHDRWFLNRVATHILAFEGESQAVWHIGNYDDYEEDRRRRLGAVADRPHRITYRKLRRN